MAQIPTRVLDSVLAIGDMGQDNQVRWMGSGFLYGRPVGPSNNGIFPCLVYIVTNRHVVADLDAIYVKLFSRDGIAEELAVPFNLQGPASSLFLHPSLDLAAALINPNILSDRGLNFGILYEGTHVARREELEELGLAEGDLCYTLGYPMGLVGERHFPIVRHGSIARIRNYLAGNDDEIWVDCDIFPGNSGGPVVSKPEAAAIEGTPRANRSTVFGIVSSYIPYKDVAISEQTGNVRIVFEENSGLAVVIPSACLIDWINTLPTPPQPAIEPEHTEPPPAPTAPA